MKLIATLLLMIGLLGSVTRASAADKYAHPNYRTENSRALHRARSMNPGIATGPKAVRPSVQLDKDLKRLEGQTAATQAHAIHRTTARNSSIKPLAVNAETKSKPIDFQYVPPKNLTAHNARGTGNAGTRRLLKPRYR